MAIFDLFFIFFSHQGNLQKFLQHILSPSHTYVYFAHPIDIFALPIWKKNKNKNKNKTKQQQQQKKNKNKQTKKKRIYQVWFLFGTIPGVDSYSRHFGTINK